MTAIVLGVLELRAELARVRAERDDLRRRVGELSVEALDLSRRIDALELSSDRLGDTNSRLRAEIRDLRKMLDSRTADA